MIVTKPQWLIVADKRTEMKWSRLFDTKNGMVDHVSRQFHKWKDAGIPVKIVRCDNAGVINFLKNGVIVLNES